MIRVQTQHPLAASAVDHLHPRGTKNDNSINLTFNRRLFQLVRELRGLSPRVLDLGCSGGGFVKSIWEMSGFAIGIEGSDFSRRALRAEWATIPDFLFTADIAKPFYLRDGPGMLTFDVVTLWEVLEHLNEDELETLNLNVLAHLDRQGYLIGSVNSQSDRVAGVEYHSTIQPFAWWRDFFTSRGWQERQDLVAYFDPHWVRGPNTEGDASTAFVFQK